MARLFTSGFELNSTTDGVEFTTNSATVQIVTTNPRSGTYHGRISGTSNGFWRQVVYTSNQSSVGYIGIAFYIVSAVNANTQFVRFSNVTNVSQGNVTLTPSNTLVLLKADGTQIGNATSAVALNTWHYLELKNDATGAGYLEARLNGVIFANGPNSSAGTWARALVGIITGAQTTADIYFDDFKINDSTGSAQTGYPGDGKVAIVRPNGNGETTQWTIGGSSAAATNWEGVDEITPNDGTDLNSTTTVGQRDLYTVDTLSIPAFSTINCIQVGCRFANLTTADATSALRLEIERESGATKAQSADIIPNSTTWASYASDGDKYMLTSYTEPSSPNGEWRLPTLTTMRIGIVAQAINVFGLQVSTMWAYVDYKESNLSYFGNITSGITGAIVNDDDISGTKYTLSEDALVHSISVQCAISLINVDGRAWSKCAIYDNSDNFVASTESKEIVGTTAKWYNFRFESPVLLSAGTYWLVIFSGIDSDQVAVRYTTDTSVVGCRQQTVGWPTLPATLTPGTDNDRNNAIYATYTKPANRLFIRG